VDSGLNREEDGNGSVRFAGDMWIRWFGRREGRVYWFWCWAMVGCCGGVYEGRAWRYWVVDSV